MKKRIYYIPSYEVEVPEKPNFTWKQFWIDTWLITRALSILTIFCIILMVIIYYAVVFGLYLYDMI